MTFRIRTATMEDVPVLRSLIQASARALQKSDYTSDQIEGALATVYGIDTVLVEDHTYFVAESIENPLDFAACGGWSKRKTLFGVDPHAHADDEMLDPQVDAAKVRTFFVHPRWSRRGVGSAMLDACENAAASAGFRRCEMGATLTGAKLFAARGYEALGHIAVPVGRGLELDVVRMEKRLTAKRIGPPLR
jgi:ribosomal protein S18 acetylase RimI-like enzyme